MQRLPFGLTILLLASCGGGPPREGTTGQAKGGAPSITAFSVADDSMKADKVGGADGALAPDNHPDASFRATVIGPVLSFMLVETDAAGTPSTDYQWDTLTGTQAIPNSVRSAATKGAETGGLGVFEGGKLLNNADGSLPPLPAGRHELTLYANDNGAFSPGDHFRLYAEGPDHTAIGGPVTVF